MNDYKSFLMNNRRSRRPLSVNVQPPKRETKVTCPIPLKTYNSKIKLFESRCRRRKTNCTTAKISKYHILERNNTGRDICHKILNTHIGFSNRHINLDVVIPVLSPILELFKNRHCRFNYFDELKRMTEKSKKCTTQKYKNQIHVRLLQFFFGSLLFKIVPLKLFGTFKNFKAIKKMIHCLLKTVPKKISISGAFKRTVRRTDAIGTLLDMQPLFSNLDISKIEWLHSVVDNEVKWIILLKLLHWFFKQYIIKVLHKYVVLIAFKNRWVYYTKDNWCKMQEEFIKEKENTNLVPCLVPWTKLNESNCNIGIYKFVPSSSGLRALFIAKYNTKEKYDDIDIVLRFLQQLYVTKLNENGISTVANCKQAILDFTNSTEDHLYYVRCDIQDAFGSIIQQKLFDIIIMYCNQLKKYLTVRASLLKTKKSQSKGNTVEFISLRKFKDVDASKEKPKLVKKEKLINKIYKLIFQRKVKFNGRVYSIKLGVPQGASVSPILSDIYYQYMFKEIFSEYANNGLLSRYVDDILYITENERYATKFLETIRHGIPEYNVRFNPSKIKSNLGLLCKSTKVKFLGFTVTLKNQIR